MDKINEIVIAITSGLLAVGLWIFKRLFKSIRQDLKIILKHLLETKND